MEVVYLNYVQRREYESDLHSKEHYLSSSEKKAWIKIQACTGFEPWPLLCRCIALPTELTSHLGAGHCVGSK